MKRSLLTVMTLGLILGLTAGTAAFACGKDKAATMAAGNDGAAAAKAGSGCSKSAKALKAGSGCSKSAVTAAVFAEAKEVDVTGQVVCAHCDLDIAKSCGKMLKAGENVYALSRDGKYDEMIEASEKADGDITVRAKLAEHGGQNWLLVLSYEIAG